MKVTVPEGFSDPQDLEVSIYCLTRCILTSRRS